MSTLEVLDKNGKSVSTIDVAQEIAEYKANEKIVRDCVEAYLANQRSGTACTKTRSEVSFSGEKPWRQKGTGRARIGDKSSPVWRKGAVAFGPRPRSFTITLPQKVKKSALKHLIAERLNNNAIIVLESLEMENIKTKDFIALLEKINAGSSVLLVLDKKNVNVEKSARNLKEVKVIKSEEINTYYILAHKKIVTTKEAFEKVLKRFSK